MDSDNETTVNCAINVDWLNAQGTSIRKVSYKMATLRLIRSDTREMFVEVNTEKAPTAIRLRLCDIMVHKKFMSEGKASIKFNRDKCMLYLSNAPPGLLMIFLKTLFVKMTTEKGTGNGKGHLEDKVQKNIRAHMLSTGPSKFEDISPVTNVELTRAQKLAGISKSTTTTPSPPNKKRRFDRMAGANAGSDGNTSKKPFSPSTLPLGEPTKLNDEQNQVLKACLDGKNIFFTGSAGTGKSFLLKKIISVLPPDGTFATASTGVAACLIGGVTLHSFAGIGAGDASLQRCYDMASRPATAQIWRKCKRLIIDEISMIDGEYFEKIEAVARHMRRNDKPFGGIQLILCGDFLQLPPVIKSSMSQQEQSKRFCFQTETWQKVISISFELKIVHRQKDQEFVRILNLIRVGHVNDEITKRLMSTSKQKIEANGILATQLCSHTNDSNLINEAKLSNLPGEEKLFQAQDSDASFTKQLDTQVLAPGRLILKIGAQVMLLKNINITDGLVNGARGVVVGYTSEGGIPIVKFKNNREYIAKPEKWTIKTPGGALITRKQIPLKLAWAFSIHKSQGLTLDCVEMSLSKVFEAGQAYVALSRAQSLDSIRILDFDSKQVWANPDVLRFYKMFRRQLHESTFIALGPKKSAGEGNKRPVGMPRMSKSLMNKPLVNIC